MFPELLDDALFLVLIDFIIPVKLVEKVCPLLLVKDCFEEAPKTEKDDGRFSVRSLSDGAEPNAFPQPKVVDLAVGLVLSSAMSLSKNTNPNPAWVEKVRSSIKFVKLSVVVISETKGRSVLGHASRKPLTLKMFGRLVGDVSGRARPARVCLGGRRKSW
mmetsp:Transcript_13818/g.29985  ORF Transcript_13818/g.29985 Transcript_13818/m.29985 type:complete len:160 (-) Transcript_13818:3102-3581(-)